MQSNQEILVEAILNQYEVDQAYLPQEILDEIYAIPSELVSSDDIINYTKRIGELIHKEDKKNELLEALEDEVHIIIHKLKFITNADRPKVILLDNLNPTIINSSKYLQACVTIAGGVPTNDMEQADKIIIIQSGKNIVAEIPTLLLNPSSSDSPAVKLNQIFLIDKKDFGKTAGNNYCVELETLAEILQPKYFFYGLEGHTWLQFQLQ